MDRVEQAPLAEFQHYNPKYRCCCGTVHSKLGTMVIAVLYTIMILFIVFTQLISGKVASQNGIFELSLTIIEFILLAGVFKALSSENEKYLMPFIVFQILMTVAFTTLLFIPIIALCNHESSASQIFQSYLTTMDGGDKKEHLDETFVGSAVLTIGMILFGIWISVWWISVMIRCYVYIRDLNVHRPSYSKPFPYKAEKLQL
uniref:MARVEL domain-containing protein n=1 Tax=Syphacia muris TaxID=451379 RepID=A0A158R5U5_9BILA